MRDFCFYLGLGALFTHELDAMVNHEWRVLPVLRSLPDEQAMFIFVVAHVPLFAVVVALMASEDRKRREVSRAVMSGLLCVHGVAHLLHVNAPGYEFSTGLSDALIYGGALAGAVYLASGWWAKRETPA